MPFRLFAVMHPAALAVLIAVAQLLITGSVLLLGMKHAPPALFPKIKLIAFTTTVAFPVLLVQAMRAWGRMGLGDRASGPVRWTPVFWLSLSTGLIFLVQGIQAPPGQDFLGVLLIQAVNAFGEELLFRGVIFAILLPLPRWQAIAVSGVLFGSMHLMQGLMGAGWDHVLWQSLITAIAGMMFAAVRYSTNSLWLTIFLHMFLNMCMIYSNIEFALGPTALFAVQRLANVIEVLVVIAFLYGTRRTAMVRAG